MQVAFKVKCVFKGMSINSEGHQKDFPSITFLTELKCQSFDQYDNMTYLGKINNGLFQTLTNVNSEIF